MDETERKHADAIYVEAAAGTTYIDTPALLVRELHAFRVWLDGVVPSQPGRGGEDPIPEDAVSRFLLERARVVKP